MLELGESHCAVRLGPKAHLVKKFILLLSLLFLVETVEADFVSSTEFVAPQAIQDARTKVIYYLESDHRHVAAVDPEGKLLWCCEVLTEKESNERHHYVALIEVDPGQDYISVSVWRGGFESATINKKTGVLKHGSVS
jgi:hypothetical protein